MASPFGEPDAAHWFWEDRPIATPGFRVVSALRVASCLHQAVSAGVCRTESIAMMSCVAPVRQYECIRVSIFAFICGVAIGFNAELTPSLLRFSLGHGIGRLPKAAYLGTGRLLDETPLFAADACHFRGDDRQPTGAGRTGDQVSRDGTKPERHGKFASPNRRAARKAHASIEDRTNRARQVSDHRL